MSMAIENDDQLVERLVPKILSSIRAKARAVESLDIKVDLEGITSIPCYDTSGGIFKQVLVEMNALKEPALSAGQTASEAAQLAYAAAQNATDAAGRVTDSILDLSHEKKAVQEVVDNETVRIADEDARQQGERARKSAEEARVKAESSREDAEAARVAAESARVMAESARSASEDLRMQQESARQQNEAGRTESESLREEAEEQRVLADNQRKEDYAAIREDLITGNKILVVSEDEYEEALDSGTIDETKLYFAYEL